MRLYSKSVSDGKPASNTGPKLSTISSQTNLRKQVGLMAPLSPTLIVGEEDWRDSYDRRKQEAEPNKLPQHHNDIQMDDLETLDFYLVYQRSVVERNSEPQNPRTVPNHDIIVRY